MPKEIKSSVPSSQRKLPYPTVSSSASMAPYTITTSSSTPQQAVSPPPSGHNHHSSASWPKDKDELLMQARHQGLNWQPIAATYFPDKTPNACRKRHERLMEKRNNADDWDSAKMDALAKAYNDVREEMWRLLANRIGGVKWQTVESKCMEKGLKTLQTYGRTASRRDRIAQHNTLQPGSGGNISDFEDYLDMKNLSPSRERSKSHPNSDDGFNDSAIGPDADHPFARPSPQSSHQVPPFNHSQSYPTPSRGHTPPFPPPARTFSNASSSAISSTGLTPTITAAPQFPSQLSQQFPSQLPSARERQNSAGSGQTLPSFSAAFGMPSISKMAGLPLTSTS